MALTVPTAGVIAGAAPNVQVPVPDTGAVLSEFGGKMAEIAGRWKQERLDTQGRRAVLGMTRDLGALRQEVQQMPDPEAAAATWDRRAAEIRSQYFTEGLDPGLATEMDLAWTELKDRHDLDLGGWMIGQRQSWQNAEWAQTSGEIAAAAPGADDTTFQALLDQGLAGIDARLASGTITPAQAAVERQQLEGQLWGTRADEAITADPQAFLDAAGRGEFAGLGQGLAGKISVAQAEVDRRSAVAAREADKAAKERQDLIGRDIDAATDLLSDGRVLSDPAFLSDPEVMAHPKYPRLKAAADLQAEVPGIRAMTPADLDRMIAIEEAKPVPPDPDAAAAAKARLDTLRGWRDQSGGAWANKPLEAQRAAGMAVPDLPDFDPANPQAFAAALPARLSNAAWLREQGYTQAAALFDADQAEALKAVIDPKADHGAKLALAEAIAAGAGADWRGVTAALGAGHEFNAAVSILADTGARGLALSILRGQQKQAQGIMAMPPMPKVQMIFSELTGHVFDDNPAVAAEILNGALARYADQAVGVNPDGKDTILPFDKDTAAIDLFSRSVAEVMGARPDRNGKLTIGGLQEVNGAQVRLQPGMPAADANEAWARVDAQLRGQRWNARLGEMDSSFTETPPDIYRALRGASTVPGAAPDLGDNPHFWWTQAKPVQAKGQPVGTFNLMVISQGRPLMLGTQDDPSVPFTFRMSDLIRETAR